MDSTEFRKFGKAAVDYLADYMDNLRDRPVLPSVEPGYLQELIPKETPQQPENWQEILKDMERVIMPGVTHWNSPQFHAYFPTANSFPGIVGEIFSAGIGCIGFSWISSPACTELEVVMMDWLGKLLDLPEEFLNSSDGPGGGVIQGSASEATFVGLLAAKEKMVKLLQAEHPDWEEGMIKAKLIAYSSDQSNSSVEKAGLLGSTPMRLLPTDDKCRLRGATLEQAIEEDRKNGLIPFYLRKTTTLLKWLDMRSSEIRFIKLNLRLRDCLMLNMWLPDLPSRDSNHFSRRWFSGAVVGTLGTTGTCAFDNLEELGPICNRENIWLHVDAAYAGTAFVCPEYRYLMAGVQYADSFNFNPHKWMLVNFDCSAMWVKDSQFLIDAFNVDRIYLKHKHQGMAPDYRHWQIPLGRRFRSLKLWMVLRLYGVEGIQKHVRNQINLTKEFETLVRADSRFEIVTEVSMGLVCFRLKGPNELNKLLHEKLMTRKKIYVIAATFRDKHILRFVVCSRMTESRDIVFAWEEISSQADSVLTGGQEKTALTHVEKKRLPIINGIQVNGTMNGHS